MYCRGKSGKTEKKRKKIIAFLLSLFRLAKKKVSHIDHGNSDYLLSLLLRCFNKINLAKKNLLISSFSFSSQRHSANPPAVKQGAHELPPAIYIRGRMNIRAVHVAETVLFEVFFLP